MNKKNKNWEGRNNYKAWVGPKGGFDIMGALQFKILTDLGLRDYHCLLDIGCGSFRAGKLFIMYLLPEKYFGIEPTEWVVKEGIKNELSRELMELKKVRVDLNSNFDLSVFGQKFDYILAQSIFSHANQNQIKKCFSYLPKILNPNGIFVATFKKGNKNYQGSKWVYPKCVIYKSDFLMGLCKQNNLIYKELNYEHPGLQTWFVVKKYNEGSDYE